MHQTNSTNQTIIKKFYESFRDLDANGMASCYHPQVQFSDPVFPSLKGEQVMAMWSMLIKNLSMGNSPWKLEFHSVDSTELSGSCIWEAHYRLSATNRSVHNIINAKFEFKDGLIIRHIDHFNFYRWARMGFGLTGSLIGWTPYFKRKVQSRVNRSLSEFMKK